MTVKHEGGADGFDYTYLSLGAGLQSSALYVLCATEAEGFPSTDLALFADTGDEPAWVYEHLDELERWGREHDGPEIRRVQKGVLSEWVADRQREGDRFVSVPLFTDGAKGAGMLRRQCTAEFKIRPIIQAVRSELGYEPRKHVKERVRCLLGITVDEVERAKPSRYPWVTNAFPLLWNGYDRARCRGVMERAGLPVPRKSSCVYCPFHSDAYWRELKQHHPEEWARAVEFDEAVRDMTMAGRRDPGYLHRSLVPLADADIGEDQTDMFGAECSGHCAL